MRSNLPVTQREYAFPSGQTLVSVTDTKGRITYGNAAFVSVSGYSADELMGQAHNLVRHPDMPEEAFRDMWHTIQGGLPWTGVVKNRRKTGDHYWVRANVTPMVDGERVIGYLSVRTEAARSEIEAAEALYKRMRDEELAGRASLALHRGQVVRAGRLGRVGLAVRGAFESIGGIGVLYGLAGLGLVIGVAPRLPLVAQVALVLALAPALGWLHHRSARLAVTAVAKDALLLAACDLSHVPGQGASGAIGQLQLCLAQLAVNLRTVVQDSRTDMENVRGAVMEITAGNQDLSSRTESQASSLEQTAASMEQITGTVKQSAASAQRGAQLAAETAQVSQRSFDAVAQVASAMGGISESARHMGDIIQVIEGVAFQTNILALNAAVEAARAGEAGRGFAVVATEVRALAHRTADAAKQIRQLITESATRVQAGGTQVAEANARMTEALAAVNSVRDVLGEISTSSGEQQLGISQVNEAVAHMDAMTQQNAAMVEQLAAAASSVNAQVENVTNTMRLFRLKAGDVSIAEKDAVALRAQAKSPPQAGTGAEAEDGIDLREAIVKHMQWKTTLRTAAARGDALDVATIRRDDCCMLGQWLHGDRSRRWHGQPQFVALVDHHKQFHQAAAAVAETIVAGQKEQGMRMMDGGTRFANATQAVVVAIKGLMREFATRKHGLASRAPTTGAGPAPALVRAASAGAFGKAPASTGAAADGDWETF